MYPCYPYPPLAVLGLAYNVLFGGCRSFRCDGQACLVNLKPPMHLIGDENIPTRGPCLITFNHYYRPGFNAWWMALGIASIIPVDVHWIVTSELTFPGKWYAPLGMLVSRWLLKRIAKVYNFTTTPPMPPRQKDIQARAYSVRQVLSFVKEHPDAILGLAPEGGDQIGGVLCQPPSGLGRFIILLAGAGFKILPVGVYEEDNKFCLHVGKAYRLDLPSGLSADESDKQSAGQVMCTIAQLLPLKLRGDYI